MLRSFNSKVLFIIIIWFRNFVLEMPHQTLILFIRFIEVGVLIFKQ